MRRSVNTVLIVVVASMALLAPTAVATPAAPPQPPQASTLPTYYEGCTDWNLQSSYPMSADHPEWVFSCWWGDNYSEENWTGWRAHDLYYWNADSSQVMWYGANVIDLENWWFWDCILYPDGIGMCDA